MQMYKGLIIALLLACASSVFGDSTGTITVTNKSAIIIPLADVSTKSISSWVLHTDYDQGAYVRNTLLQDYWTSNGGPSTNMPVHLLGGYAGLDGVKWYRIENSKRRIAYVTNASGARIYLAFGLGDAVTGEGAYLNVGERVTYEGQKQISAFCDTSAVVLTAEEVE